MLHPLILLFLFFRSTNAAIPIYLGCYKDSVIRDLNVAFFSNSTLMSIDLCLSFCTGNATDNYGNRIGRGQGLGYAGLQGGKECYCSTTYGIYGSTVETACSTPCAADTSKMCGGDLVNSIWKTWIDSPSSNAARNGNCPVLAQTANFTTENGFNHVAFLPNSKANMIIISILTGILFLMTTILSFIHYSRNLTMEEYQGLLAKRKRDGGNSSFEISRKSWAGTVVDDKYVFKTVDDEMHINDREFQIVQPDIQAPISDKNSVADSIEGKNVYDVFPSLARQPTQQPNHQEEGKESIRNYDIMPTITFLKEFQAAGSKYTRNQNTRYTLTSQSKKSDLKHYDQELFIDGNKVIWSKENILHRSYTFPELDIQGGDHIVKALFTNFICDTNVNNAQEHPHPLKSDNTSRRTSCRSFSSESLSQLSESNENSEEIDLDRNFKLVNSLCIVFKRQVKFYFDNGRSFVLQLPFEVDEVWSLGIGLLFKSAPSLSLTGALDIMSMDRASDLHNRLFSLLHPLEEAVVISVEKTIPSSLSSNIASSSYEYETIDFPQDEQVLDVHNSVYTDKSPVIVVSFNKQLGKHRFWVCDIKPVLEKEYHDLSAKNRKPHHYDIDIGVRRKSMPDKTFGEELLLAEKGFSEEDYCSDFVGNGLKSVVFLRQIFEVLDKSAAERYGDLANGRDPASKIVFGHALDGNIVVFLVFESSKTVLAYLLLPENTDFPEITSPTLLKSKFYFQLSAISCISVQSTRENQSDVLFLMSDHTFSIWTGDGESSLITCTLPNNFQTFFESSSTSTSIKTPKRRRDSQVEEDEIYTHPSRRSRVVSVSDNVYNRVNMTLSNGLVFRASLDFRPKTYLVQKILQALSHVLPQHQFFALRTRFLSTVFGEFGVKNNVLLENSEIGGFIISLFSFLHSDSTLNQFTGKTSTAEQNEDEDDWDYLVASSFHKSYAENSLLSCLDKPLIPNTKGVSTMEKFFEISKELGFEFHNALSKETILEYLPVIMLSLHLVYEDLKLNVVTMQYMHHLQPLLSILAFALNWKSFADYYDRNGGERLEFEFFEGIKSLVLSGKDSVFKVSKKLAHNPPDIYQYLHDKVTANFSDPDKSSAGFPLISQLPTVLSIPQDWYNKIIPLVDTYADCDYQTRLICDFYDVLLRDISFDDNDTRNVDLVSLMIEKEFKIADIDCLPFGIALPLREALHACREQPPADWPPEGYSLIGREDLALLYTGQLISSIYNPIMKDVDEKYSEKYAEVEDVKSIIDSVNVASAKSRSGSCDFIGYSERITKLRFNDDSIKEVDAFFDSKRVETIKIDLTADLSEQDIAAEQQKILLSLSNRVFSLSFGKSIYKMATAASIPSEVVVIEDIVISARLPPINAIISLDTSVLELDWPSFHEGFSIGIQIPSSEIVDLDPTWIYHNQDSPDCCKHSGFLMALGFSGHLRKMQSWMSFRYLAGRHDLTTIGILLGYGASFVGVADDHIEKILTVHLPAVFDEGISNLQCPLIIQTAALVSMGLMNMQSGNKKWADRALKEIDCIQPSLFLEARRDSGLMDGYSLAAGFSFGYNYLQFGDDERLLAREETIEKLVRLVVGGTVANSKPSNDDITINVDTTSPAATVALSLMFLKTNNQAIADHLVIPSTPFLLDYVRPDFLLLRIVCRSLIMFDSVSPTRSWINSLVPKYILDHVEKGRWAAEATSGVLPSNEDEESIFQAYYAIGAGACLAIALKYAGSANSDAFDALIWWTDYFVKLSSQSAITFSAKLRRSIIRSCFDVTLLSLSVVMSGSGNPGVLKRIKQVSSSRIGSDVNFGNHLSNSMAMGFLFLGGGRFTLSSSSRSIAYLLCALYPKFPTSANDNSLHLQAFRHLWVLAVVDRCLITKDVNTQELCRVPILVRVKTNGLEGGLDIPMVTPCTLPAFPSLLSITVDSSRYWGIKIGSADNQFTWYNLLSTRTLSVKRRAGHLRYSQDPKGIMNVVSACFPRNFTETGSTNAGVGNFEEFIKSFSDEPQILAFSHHLCRYESEFGSFCKSVLYDCLIYDKLDIMYTYLCIHKAMIEIKDSLGHNRKRSEDLPHLINSIWNLKLAFGFYNKLKKDADYDQQRIGKFLIQDLILNCTKNQLEGYLNRTIQPEIQQKELDVYLKSGGFERGAATSGNFKWLFLVYYGIPSPDQLQEIIQELNTPITVPKCNELKGKLEGMEGLVKIWKDRHGKIPFNVLRMLAH